MSVGLAAFIGLVYVIVVVLLGHRLGPAAQWPKILATHRRFALEPVRERPHVSRTVSYTANGTPTR
jgi:hypothetical protein